MYAEVVAAEQEFNLMKERLSKMRVACYGIFRLEDYETRECSQGTEFVFVGSCSTEQACLEHVEDVMVEGKCDSYYNYVVVPVTRTGIGGIFIGTKDVTRRIRDYNGPCKVMLKPGNNPQRWFQAKSLSHGIESAVYAEVHITDEKPSNWVEEEYDKHSLVPKWKTEATEEDFGVKWTYMGKTYTRLLNNLWDSDKKWVGQWDPVEKKINYNLPKL